MSGPVWVVRHPHGDAWALPSRRDAELFMRGRGYTREWLVGAYNREDLSILWPRIQIMTDWRAL